MSTSKSFKISTHLFKIAKLSSTLTANEPLTYDIDIYIKLRIVGWLKESGVLTGFVKKSYASVTHRVLFLTLLAHIAESEGL